MNFLNKTKPALIIPMFLCALPAWAQTDSTSSLSAEAVMYMVGGLIIVVGLIVVGLAYNVFNVLRIVEGSEAARRAKEAGVDYVPEPGILTQLFDSWTKQVPLEKEKDILLDHEYDGIRELDNHLPPWWLALFYGSIVFGVIYLLGYHVMNWWPLQDEEYNIAVAKAESQMKSQMGAEGVLDENTVTYNEDPAFISSGKQVFDQACVACHRPDAGGSIGPNLTDNYWINGGDIKDIFRVIKYGVPAKGMAAWEKALSPKQISQVSSYIVSLVGSNPPNPKEPQGELVE